MIRRRVGNVDIDVDIIDDTFDVSISISRILSYKSIDRGIDDTLLAFFYRHYIDTSQLTCKYETLMSRTTRRRINWHLQLPLTNAIRPTVGKQQIKVRIYSYSSKI